MKKYLFLLLIIISSCSKEELDDYIEPPNPNPIPQTIYSTSIQNHEWNDGWYSRDRESYPVEFFSAFEYFDYDLDGDLDIFCRVGFYPNQGDSNAANTNNDIRILINNNNTWTLADRDIVDIQPNRAYRKIVTVDIDNDGDLDMIGFNAEDPAEFNGYRTMGGLDLFRFNDGKFYFEEIIPYQEGNPTFFHSGTAADINNDGRIDINDSGFIDSDNNGMDDNAELTSELDSDNDNCFDVIEAGFQDPNLDGVLGDLPDIVNFQGLIINESTGYTAPDDKNVNTLFDFQELNILSPGKNGFLEVCKNSANIDLFKSLNGNPDLGGTWSPALISGTSIFDPRKDVDGLEIFNKELKGELTVVISEKKIEKNYSQELSESDISIINKMINKLTIKEITEIISQNKDVSKKEIYNYCLKLKNEI